MNYMQEAHIHKSIACVHMYIHIHVHYLFTHIGVHYVRVQVTIPDKLGHAQHTLAINHEKNFKYKYASLSYHGNPQEF